MARVVSQEAKQYIQKGRDACYEQIEILYRTEWQFHGKFGEVKVYFIQDVQSDLIIRCETKFRGLSLSELIDYFKMTDKRLAWQGQHYDSLEEVRAYPLDTSIWYCKLHTSCWPQGLIDSLVVTHGVMVKEGQYYLTSTACEHHECPPLKPPNSRLAFKQVSNYFEESHDKQSVKHTYVC
jgi:hypothetical protein